METKSAKPSKADLLKELESIRESLVSDGAAMQDALNTSAESKSPAPAESSKENLRPTASEPTAQELPKSAATTEVTQSEQPHSLMKKSYLEIDESDYDYELKIPAHATESQPETASPEPEANGEATENDTSIEHTVPEAPAEPEELVEIDLAEQTPAQESLTPDLPEVEAIELDEAYIEEDTDDVAELAHMLSHDSEHESSDIEHAIHAEASALEPEPISEDDMAIESNIEVEDIAVLNEPVLASEIPTMEVPAIDDAIITQKLGPTNTPHVLPGQQSLFEDTIEMEAVQEPEPKAKKASKPSGLPAAKQTENPFLPQHIKAKLERERSLYEQEINAAVQTNYARQFAPSAAQTALEPKLAEHTELETVSTSEPKPEIAESDREQLIDALVSEFLPKIEASLRERLRETLAETSEE